MAPDICSLQGFRDPPGQAAQRLCFLDQVDLYALPGQGETTGHPRNASPYYQSHRDHVIGCPMQGLKQHCL